MNVDGTFLGQAAGFQTSDVEIRKGDSIRVFVELTSALQEKNEPQLVEDDLVFTLESGVQQKINLRAFSWDAEMHNGLEVKRGEETVLGEPDESGYQKPIVIYGGIKVDSLGTLTIREGATLYFHENAGIDVYGKLKAAGTAEKPVTMRGDRIDRMFDYLPYDRTPGQWQGIRLRVLASVICCYYPLILILFLVFECSEFALDGQAALAFFDVTHNLGIDVEALADGDNLLGNLRTNVDLHTVTHVEYLIHLLPVGL